MMLIDIDLRCVQILCRFHTNHTRAVQQSGNFTSWCETHSLIETLAQQIPQPRLGERICSLEGVQVYGVLHLKMRRLELDMGNLRKLYEDEL